MLVTKKRVRSLSFLAVPTPNRSCLHFCVDSLSTPHSGPWVHEEGRPLHRTPVVSTEPGLHKMVPTHRSDCPIPLLHACARWERQDNKHNSFCSVPSSSAPRWPGLAWLPPVGPLHVTPAACWVVAPPPQTSALRPPPQGPNTAHTRAALGRALLRRAPSSASWGRKPPRAGCV